MVPKNRDEIETFSDYSTQQRDEILRREQEKHRREQGKHTKSTLKINWAIGIMTFVITIATILNVYFIFIK